MLELEPCTCPAGYLHRVSLLLSPHVLRPRLLSHQFRHPLYTACSVRASMRFFTTLCVLAVAALASARSPQHVGKKLAELRSRAPPVARALHEPEVEKRAASPFATAKTKSTLCNAGYPSSKLTCCRVCCQWHSASNGRLQHWYAT
jgi:hypothetical protein